MDLAQSIEPNSEQVNAEDLLAGPRTVTITGVEAGNKEQPVFIHLREIPGRTFRPGKTVRRVLVAGWGKDSSAYIGRRLTLYNDTSVKWGGVEIGGVRISAMSDIDKPLVLALTVSRGKRAPLTVQPLATEPDPVAASLDDINRADSMAALKAAWDIAGRRGVQGHPDVIAKKEQRKTELTVEPS